MDTDSQFEAYSKMHIFSGIIKSLTNIFVCKCMVLIFDGNPCARKTQYLLFDLFKAFDCIESSHKSDIFTRKDPFSFMRAQYVMSYHG